jgi:hypothetical protein
MHIKGVPLHEMTLLAKLALCWALFLAGFLAGAFWVGRERGTERESGEG